MPVEGASGLVTPFGPPLYTRYWGSFCICTLICIVLQVYARSRSNKARKQTGGEGDDVMSLMSLSNNNNAEDGGGGDAARRAFASFQRNYLVVYLLAVFADWLQGPYVYELYVYYGFDKGQISELFVCGFGSSMIVGTFVGGLADKMGRKKMCVLYSVCYVVACFTKLVPSYWVLMLGRFLSGISTSLLFSVFESWMVCEHNRRGFDSSLLGETFAYQTFGNGVVAVVAGLVANSAADSFGYVAPFMISTIPLVLLALLVSFTWQENYGNQQQNYLSSLQKGLELIRNDSRLAALGMAQSAYEGALYTFIFVWTPALKTVAELTAETDGSTVGLNSHGSSEESNSQYLGIIFAVFMVCVMIGSSVFRIVMLDGASAIGTPQRSPLMRIPLYVHLLAALSMGTITLFLSNKLVVYTMFLVFEGTTGAFYPSYGMIKSEKIPEDIRSAVMNILRIPLNIFVVLLLLKFKFLSARTVLLVCTFAHCVAFACYAFFFSTIKPSQSAEDNGGGGSSSGLLSGSSSSSSSSSLYKDEVA